MHRGDLAKKRVQGHIRDLAVKLSAAPPPGEAASDLRLTHFIHNACSEYVPMTLHGSEQLIKRRVATPLVLPKE